jgi:hypothetical protein
LTLAKLWENNLERLNDQGVSVISRRHGKPRIARNVLTALASNRPVQAVYAWQLALAELLTETIAGQRFHGVHLRGAEHGLYIRAQLRRQGVSTTVVWDSVDCISLLFEQAAHHSRSRFGRWVSRLELPRTRRYEAQAIQRFAGVLVASPKDMAARQPTYAGRSLFCQTVLTQIISRLSRHLRHQPTICKTPHLDYFIESIFLWPLIGAWAAMVVTLLIYPLVGLALERAPVRAYIASLLKNYESLQV